MSYSVISQIGSLSSGTLGDLPRGNVTITNNTGTGSGFTTGNTYNFCLDLFNASGRSYFSPYTSSSLYQSTVSSNGNNIVLTVTVPSGWSGVGVWWLGGSNFYQYADCNLSGTVTYKNGASSGISISVNGQTMTITISQAGPTSQTTGLAYSNSYNYYNNANTQTTTITVPNGQNWLLKSLIFTTQANVPIIKITVGNFTILTLNNSGISTTLSLSPYLAFYPGVSNGWQYYASGGSVQNPTQNVCPSILQSGETITLTVGSIPGASMTETAGTITYDIRAVTI